MRRRNRDLPQPVTSGEKMTCAGARREWASPAQAQDDAGHRLRTTRSVLELEEALMSIVGGLDVHRKQITFDYLDTVSGEVERGQILAADRGQLAGWLGRFAGCDDVAFAAEACTGWRYVIEELQRAGVAAHLADPAETAAAWSQAAGQDRPDGRQADPHLVGRGAAAGVLHPADAGVGVSGAAGAVSRPAAGTHRLGPADPRGAVPPGRRASGRGWCEHRRRPRAARPGRRWPAVAGRAGPDRDRHRDARGHRATRRTDPTAAARHRWPCARRDDAG